MRSLTFSLFSSNLLHLRNTISWPIRLISLPIGELKNTAFNDFTLYNSIEEELFAYVCISSLSKALMTKSASKKWLSRGIQVWSRIESLDRRRADSLWRDQQCGPRVMSGLFFLMTNHGTSQFGFHYMDQTSRERQNQGNKQRWRRRESLSVPKFLLSVYAQGYLLFLSLVS